MLHISAPVASPEARPISAHITEAEEDLKKRLFGPSQICPETALPFDLRPSFFLRVEIWVEPVRWAGIRSIPLC